MQRHQWVASQPTALRLVVQQAHGGAASAAVLRNRSITLSREPLPPKGQPGGSARKGTGCQTVVIG